MSRLSCVQSCLCPDYCAFKVAYVQTIVRSNLLMSRLSCVQSCLCPDYRAFKVAYVQTIMRSKLPMSRLSCLQRHLCPDFRAFKDTYVQTFVRSLVFSDRVILNARHPLVRSFRSEHIDFRSGTSTWVWLNQFKSFNSYLLLIATLTPFIYFWNINKFFAHL